MAQPAKKKAGSIPEEELARLKAANVPVKAFSPSLLLAFAQGQRTLGEVARISKAQQLEIAKKGRRFLEDGLKEKAIQIFAGLEALDPYDAYVQLCLGTIALESEEFEQAELRFTRAIFLNPVSVPALAYRGELRISQGKVNEGLDDLMACVEADPKGEQESSARAKALLASLKASVSGNHPAVKPAAAAKPAPAAKPAAKAAAKPAASRPAAKKR
jgi:tetratricopeptide (TPR) repeat protein